MYQREDHGFGPMTGGASAMPVHPFGRAAMGDARVSSHSGPDRIRRTHIPRYELVVDLGSRVGSLDWFRGAATLAAMIAALVHVAPGIRPLPGPAILSPAEQHQMRALAIAPAYGADTGVRRAAPDLAEPPTATSERPELDLTATLGPGDGFARLLAREGVGEADATEAARLVAEAMPLPDLVSGASIAITLGRRPDRRVERPLEQISFRARFDLALTVKRVDGRLTLERTPIAVDNTPLRLTGDVGESLYRSARAAGAPPSVVADYIRAIAAHVDIGDIQADDSYDIVMEHDRAATGEVRIGRLLYAGIVHGGKRLQLVRWTQDGRAQWFDATGAGETHDGFTLPVSGGRLSSGFGMRFHPVLGFSRMHQGVDLAAPYGTPIVAASDGTVSFTGWHGGHGNFVQIVHGGGMGTGYGHMSSYVVRPGEHVAQGQLIGYVGSTGLSTGPHCHFEVYRNGVPIDPQTARFAMTTRIAGPELVRFRATLARLTASDTTRMAATGEPVKS